MNETKDMYLKIYGELYYNYNDSFYIDHNGYYIYNKDGLTKDTKINDIFMFWIETNNLDLFYDIPEKYKDYTLKDAYYSRIGDDGIYYCPMDDIMEENYGNTCFIDLCDSIMQIAACELDM